MFRHGNPAEASRSLRFLNCPRTFPLEPLIRDRWSPVCFTSKKIEPAVLGSLFEAARWAPSSYNEQPWGFCLATQDQPQAAQ